MNHTLDGPRTLSTNILFSEASWEPTRDDDWRRHWRDGLDPAAVPSQEEKHAELEEEEEKVKMKVKEESKESDKEDGKVSQSVNFYNFLNFCIFVLSSVLKRH